MPATVRAGLGPERGIKSQESEARNQEPGAQSLPKGGRNSIIQPQPTAFQRLHWQDAETGSHNEKFYLGHVLMTAAETDARPWDKHFYFCF